MSEQITVTLPDGSSREYASGTTPAEVAASIGKGLAKAAIAAKADGEWVDLDRPLEHHVDLQIVVPDSDDGREVLRHSTAHVMAEAVTRSVPGRQVRDRSRDRRRLLLRLRPPDGADLQRRRPRPHRSRDARDREGQDQRFVREELTYDEALEVFADQPYKREIIEKVRTGAADERRRGRGRRRRRGVSVYRNVAERRGAASSTCAAARTFRPRNARRVQAARRSPARTGAATRRARCCSASTAPRGSRRRRWPSTCTGSRRPSVATTASSASSSTCSRSRRRSARAWRCSTRRVRSCGASWRSTRASGTRRRATSS